MFTPTAWGFEETLGNHGKRIFVNNQYCSTEILNESKERIFVVGQEGLIYFETGDDKEHMTGIWLQENDRIEVPQQVWFRFAALRDTVMYQFSDAKNHSQPGGRMADNEYRSLLASFIRLKNKARILEVGEAETIASALAGEGRTIGMCNGCFDLLHLGHVELLMQAKNRCDVLFVAVNSDQSIKQLKGPTRPFVDEVGRMGMVAANRNVDYVIRAKNTTCLDIVDAIHPNVYITTQECGPTSPEAREVVRQGGRVEVIDMLPGYNTTKIGSSIAARK